MGSPTNGNCTTSNPSSSENSPLRETRNMPSSLSNDGNYSISSENSATGQNKCRPINGVARRLKNNEINANNAIHRKSLINLEDVVSSNQQVWTNFQSHLFRYMLIAFLLSYLFLKLYLFLQDDEWDTILGELSVLEKQFDNELYNNLGKPQQNGTSSQNKAQKVRAK